MSERTHHILFERAPVALWDVDIDQVAEVARAIPARAMSLAVSAEVPPEASPEAPPEAPPEASGAAPAWASHLGAHLDDLRALAAAVVVRDANRRARSLAAGARDAAALLAYVPAASAARLLAAVAAGQPAFAEETTWRANEAEQRVRITFDLLDDAGRARGLIGVVEVASEAGAPAAVVAQLERALADATEELSSFVYAASHDLQAPLRAVVGYTDLLQRRYGKALDERASKYIERAGEGGRRMRAMVEGLLTLSRVFTSKRAHVPVDAALLLAQAEERLRARITETSARITHDALPTVTGDSVQLVQMLEQILDNAIKFRRVAPPVIHIGARRAPDAWILSVTDNGIGMESERLGSIFAPFQRLHPSDVYPGTGLGLTIVAKIVQRHRGQVWATSQPDQGSTLHVALPDSRT